VPLAPLLDQHADFATPWDLAELLCAAAAPVDVMIEAKAKDLAVEWLRTQMERLFPALAAAEERSPTATSSPASRRRPQSESSPIRR
jgi:UV DNA damage endonuclease